MSFLIAVVVSYLYVFAVVGLFAYFFSALGLYRLARQENISNAGLAWIPICNYYIVGLLLKDRFTINHTKFDNPEVLLPFFAIVALIGAQVPSFGILLVIGAGIPIIASIYHMISKYKGTQVWLWTIVCALLSPVYAILLFYFSLKPRNDKKGTI